MGWRLIVDSEPRPGAENMAIDQALLEGVQAGGRPALRFYSWTVPCLSLGRNQPAVGRLDAGAAAARGIEVVRRPTGGMAVLHDREVTYGVAVQVGVLGSPRETYAAVNRALVAGLRRVGVQAKLVGGRSPDREPTTLEGRFSHRPVPKPLSAACFHDPAPGEVSAGGRKLVGSAQRCERRILLQHGSILLEGDQAAVAELIPEAALGPLPASPTSLAELLGRAPPAAGVVVALVAGFEEVLGIRFAREDPSPAELERAGQLVTHYRSAAWTWRR